MQSSRWLMALAIVATTGACADDPRVTAPTVPADGPVVAVVRIAPDTVRLSVDGTQALQVAARDSDGEVVTTAAAEWSSAAAGIATVSADGVVRGKSAGTTRVHATVRGKRGEAVVIVDAPAPPPSPVQPPTDEPPPEEPTPAPAGCAAAKPGWIWCDDFEQDRLAQYFEYESANGGFTRVAGVGAGGSTGMRARFAKGQVEAGNLKVAFGRTPSATFAPVDGGTATYRELYWRVKVRTQAGWIGGSGEKLSRATILAGSNWQQAMIAHVWGADAPDNAYLAIDPASGTSASGALQTREYNDFPNLRWLGAVRSTTPWFDAAHVGQWRCVETHVRLNDAGQANGVFELWVNGQREAQKTGLNWVGSYDAYGLNAVFLENYWNSGSPQAQERYFDDFVVSTQPIGCE